jgi:hypothetical protein
VRGLVHYAEKRTCTIGSPADGALKEKTAAVELDKDTFWCLNAEETYPFTRDNLPTIWIPARKGSASMPKKDNEQSNLRNRSKRGPILGQSHGLSDIEGQIVQQKIREEQHSSRELFIPDEDLAQEATTEMSAEVRHIVDESKVLTILLIFNRDYLYGQGRFDEYKDGLLLKWGDGYSRRHIWVSVADGNLLFETSHIQRCEKPYCNGTHHVLTRDLYMNIDVINEELGDLFRHPVYEPSDD